MAHRCELFNDLKLGLKQRFHYPISVDSVVFGYTSKTLKVALIQQKKEPFLGQWALPGGFMEGDETVEETARRKLKEETGIENVYLDQFHVFNKKGRDPRGPTLTIAFFALINSDQCHLIASEDAAAAKWWPAYELPHLAFDPHEIYLKALDSLLVAFLTRPLAFELLSEQFTLTDLQGLYEQVFNTKLDKRNFRKKIVRLDYIKASGNRTEGVRHRPAQLYQYDSEGYALFSKENLI